MNQNDNNKATYHIIIVIKVVLVIFIILLVEGKGRKIAIFYPSTHDRTIIKQRRGLWYIKQIQKKKK